MQFPLHPTVTLDGKWTLVHSLENHELMSFADFDTSGLEQIPAQVPGNFELDLFAVGKIEDPFIGMNIAQIRPLEKYHVWYGRRFEADLKNDHQPLLLFHGVDCYADYFLNGQLIGQSDNALVEHEFEVEGILREGTNELVVHLRPSLQEAKNFPYSAGLEAAPDHFASLHIRKAPHCYGWDIMPCALSAGLWRPVSLVWQPRERLEEVFLHNLKVEADKTVLRLFYRGHFADDAVTDGTIYEIEIEAHGVGSQFKKRERVLFQAGQIIVEVTAPALWWPRGRGTAHLYNIEVRLLKNEAIIDCARFRHGIRSIELERTSTTTDQGDGEFCFRVNGEKFFAMGSNHVPLDAYHSRDRSRIPRFIELAVEAGCNFLRCWGGNVYEDDLFYDLCDEHGILVWQDFAMACATYPQDAEFQRRLAAEAEKVVRRLRSHACLALWAGDNECDSSGFLTLMPNYDPTQNVLTRRVLPDVVGSHDPGRTYLPSSPYIDQEACGGGLKYLSENHPWGPRDYFKSEFYLGMLCHFASEIGYHGCPSPDSIRRFISPEKLWPPGNDEWLLHATSSVPGVNLSDYRIELMSKQIDAFFGITPTSLEEFAQLSQIVQAEAKKFFIEFFRTGKWRRTGILWWNLCDGWPQFSDAVVDYYFEKKLAFDYIRRAQQPVLLTFREPANAQLELVACNDTREDLSLTFGVRDMMIGSTTIKATACVRGDAVTPLLTLPYRAGEQHMYGIEWDSAQGSGINHYLAGKPCFDAEQYSGWFQKIYGSHSLML